MVIAFAALIGLALGSFATMLSWRLPRRASLAGRSRCPACNTALGWRDLVPVLSWAAHRGRCRHCGATVHWRYPAIELVMAVFAALAAWRFGATPMAALVVLLATCLLAMAVADLETGLLPDALQIPAALLGAAAAALGDRLPAAVMGAAAALLLGLALRYGFRWLRGRHGLGLGDVKLLAVAGLWLGPAGLVPFLVIAGGLGAVFGLAWRRWADGYFPFGPALCAALFALVLFPVSLSPG